MKHLLTRRIDLAILCAMALVAGLIVALSGQRDTMLFVMAMPVFMVAALMGFRRSPKPQTSEVVVTNEPAL